LKYTNKRSIPRYMDSRRSRI